MEPQQPKMSGRERILAALHHQPVDRLPFAPLLDAYLMMGLPPEMTGDPSLSYRSPRRQIDTLKSLGADLMVRGISVLEPVALEAAQVQALGTFAPPVVARTEVKDNEFAEIIETPVGTLTGRWKLTDRHGTLAHFTRYVVNNYEELKVFTYAVDHLSMEVPRPRPDIYERYDGLLGDEGMPTSNLMNTPFMQLIEFVFGLQNTYLLLHEHRAEMEHVLERLHQSQRLIVEALAASPAQVVIQYENTSSTLLSPAYYRRYCLPVQNDYARVLKTAGKTYLIHMCGKLRAFIPDFAGAEFSGISDIAPGPTGDLPLDQAAASLTGKVVTGGIDATTFASTDAALVEREASQLVRNLKPHRGVIMGSGDAMPKNTRVENVRRIVEIVHALGVY